MLAFDKPKYHVHLTSAQLHHGASLQDSARPPREERQDALAALRAARDEERNQMQSDC